MVTGRQSDVHELSIAMSLIELASEEAERRGGVRVEAIHLKLGPLSGVVKDALIFSYELARENTSLAGCRLLIEEVPIVVYCARCQARRTLKSTQRFTCPECDEPASEIVGGRELELFALEIAQ
jgi:hydrogenase nickel incorporation protein HypA/HybF